MAAVTTASKNYLVLIGSIPLLLFVRTPRIIGFVWLLFDMKSAKIRNYLYKTRLYTFIIGMVFSMVILVIVACKVSLLLSFL